MVQNRSRVLAFSDSPVFTLEGGEPIPSNSLFVSNKWNSIDIDEILLERPRVMEELRSLANHAACDQAFSRIPLRSTLKSPQSFCGRTMKSKYTYPSAILGRERRAGPFKSGT